MPQRALLSHPSRPDSGPFPVATVTPSTHSVRPDVDLVIPVLNEEARIGPTVDAICRWADDIGRTVRLTVVDNGSADATAECVDRAASHRLAARVVGCRVRGKGAAVRDGVLRSTAPIVGYCDADLSTPASAMTDALELIDDGWEVVVGSRHCAGAAYAVAPSLLRRSGSWCFRRVAKHYVGAVADTQCGFKLFTGDAARHVFAHLELTSFAFDVELIARALRSGYRLVELPVLWSDASGSTFRPVRDGVSSFRDLASLHRSLAVGESGQ